ncbi:unnamed protein product [Bursaphelenchus okinawaensis]|uniref:Mediator of RNA polymerase II transcription subunit 14 n=1 Tax=Bursaphelenchus okinawaensis TaxID=465554 RepID=A0A811LTK0_9BILA|nr:unnamed protein product [Bursaphelenchus okinawaensis]CAG9127722.1 unnamed protein product [Bursaphelenchus okinawaensis]
MQADLLQERTNSTGEEYYDDGLYPEMDEGYNNRYPLPEVPDDNNPESKPLSFILEQAVNYTYEEFLSITQKQGINQIEFLKYSHSTRCKFVKLYALVKWIKSWQKFDQLNKINYFLDDISAQFVDTTEFLLFMDQIEMPFLGIGRFDVDAAIDVLVNHGLSRLPRTIATSFIPDKELSKKQKISTINRIDNLIKNDLIRCSADINDRINIVSIKDGVLTLTAENEFTIKLTRTEHHGEARWQILTLDILVHDHEVGLGHELIHPQHCLDSLCVFIQSEIQRHPQNTFSIIFNILHTFCLRLQLDVFRCRVQYYKQVISKEFLHVEYYCDREGILVFYLWPEQRRSQTYKVIAKSDRRRKFLHVTHYPQGQNLPRLEIVDGVPQVHEFLITTAQHRSAERLKQVKRLLNELSLPKTILEKIGDAKIRLLYSIMPFLNTPDCENLHIIVNLFTGRLKCQVEALLYDESAQNLLTDLGDTISNSLDIKKTDFKIEKIILKLRLKLFKLKTMEALNGLHTHVIQEDPWAPFLGTNVPEEKVMFSFHLDPNYFLLATFDYDDRKEFQSRFYLIDQTNSVRNVMEVEETAELREQAVPKLDLIEFKGTKKSPPFLPLSVKRTMSWEVRRRQLKAFMALLDGKVQIEQLRRALRQLDVDFEVKHEEVVGGNVIDIVNCQFLMNFDSAGFENSIRRVCLRLHRHTIFHLEFCITDPPVKTPEMERSNLFRFVPAIHHAQLQPFSNYQENLKRHLIDQLVTYGRMNKVVKEFATVYYGGYMQQHVDIAYFNYYKLILTYGKDRDLALIVSKKSNYKHLIPNFSQLNSKTNTSVRSKTWNPHVLVSAMLMDNITDTDDLIGLVDYLINTEKSLRLIYNFAQMHLKTDRSREQLLGLDVRPPNAFSLSNVIIPLSEYVIRLVHGFAHVEFCLLKNNKVGVRANQLKSTEYGNENPVTIKKLPGFSFFWKKFAVASRIETIDSKEHLEENRANGNPASVPPNERTDNPIDNYPMSCPPQYDERFEEFVAYAERQEKHDLNKLLVIDPEVFEQAMTSNSVERTDAREVQVMMPKPVSPLEAYLHGLNFISKLPKTLNVFAHSQNPIQHLPISELNSDDWSVSFCLPGVTPTTTAYPPWTTKVRIFMCPTKFHTTIKLEFVGPNTPQEADIDTFVKFFETVIVSTDNEYALHSYLSMCRVNATGVFNAFASLMKAHMDPFSYLNCHNWTLNIQLILFRPAPVSHLPTTEVNKADFISGILIHPNKEIQITIGLCPTKALRIHKHVKMSFIYNLDNEVLRYSPFHAMDENIPQVESILTGVVKTSPDQCVIWPSVHRLVERFR